MCLFSVSVGGGRIARCNPTELAWNTYSVGDTIGKPKLTTAQVQTKVKSVTVIDTVTETDTTQAEEDTGLDGVDIFFICLLSGLIIILLLSMVAA